MATSRHPLYLISSSFLPRSEIFGKFKAMSIPPIAGGLHDKLHARVKGDSSNSQLDAYDAPIAAAFAIFTIPDL
ncbi:uncharacterized protein BYT42DRAFT_516496 [Radiomyces spectabilis]|uniref:uncharacterized protein n=1 Tax=Radiomyces spectabilis TaxID=64574 RepID=UPI0022200506|nr:uncharacterized protein BYT42DRAFT_516496 [Radiomyces spectabilis]KAI8378067.1 hypothetical protein BYT42DRAFT_516496 [Radiomyces spectabilis]